MVCTCACCCGACCYEGGECTVETAANCAAYGGDWQGKGTTCDPSPCECNVEGENGAQCGQVLYNGTYYDRICCLDDDGYFCTHPFEDGCCFPANGGDPFNAADIDEDCYRLDQSNTWDPCPCSDEAP